MARKKTTHREFFSLAVPNVLSNLTVPLAGLVDTALLGHLEDIVYLAGVSLGSILFDYIYWMFGFFRMSTTGLTAQAVGARRKKDILLIPARGLLLALACGLIILVLHKPLGELGFTLLNGADSVKQEGLSYFHARIWGAPVVLANFVLTGWFLGRGKGKVILWLSLVANGCNIILDYLFIFHFHWAAWGAGLATMISQYVMFIFGMFLAYPSFSKASSWLTLNIIFEKKAFKQFLGLNRDILIRTFMLISSFSYFINASSGIGTVYLAANSILLKIVSIASYFIDGLAFAVESLAGRFMGAGNQQALSSVIRLALWSAAGTGLFFATIFCVFPDQLFYILTSQSHVLLVLKEYRFWLFPVMIFGSAAYIWDGVFLGLSKGPLLRNCMIFSALTVFFPLAFWASNMKSIHLLWLSMSLFMLARAVSLGLTMKLNRQADSSA